MRWRSVEHLPIRTILLIGFGLTLSLWVVVGYQITGRLTQVERDAAAANERYIRAQEVLSSVRAQSLFASALIRDVVLDPDPRVLADRRAEIERAYESIEASLLRYVPALDTAAERESIARLKDEIHAFRAASVEVLGAPRNGGATDPRLLLQRFMPHRETAVRISEEVQSLNRAAFVNEQQTLADQLAGMQRQVWTVFGIALVVSVGIGYLSSWHGARLEQRLMHQRAREESVAADLQRLSGRLVQSQEQEQRRIARELHDDIGQMLSALKVELAVAERKLERLHGTSGMLADAHATADSAMRSVRDLTYLLHPSALDDLGLLAALESHINDFRRRHVTNIVFEHDGIDRRQIGETERALYRIVQEALTNIVRHALATSARVELRGGEHALQIVIQDNGVGFDPDEVERPGRRRGLGLLGMRERVAQLHGSIRVASAPGCGTRIEIEVPRTDRGSLPDDAAHDTTASAGAADERAAEVSRG